MEVRVPKDKVINNPSNIAEVFKAVLNAESEVDQDKEHFWTIGLNMRNVIKYVDLTSLGTISASLVHPREVFRLAITKGTSHIILGHNHPSGTPDPSGEDMSITRRLADAGKILGIEVLDHIIIAGPKFYSFKYSGLL